jgi:ribosomal protein S21
MDIPIFWKKYQTNIPEVLVKNQNLDDALRILKKRVECAGVLSGLKKRRLFISTADRRRAKRRIAADKAPKLQKLTA